ncbi:hypothetical protein ACWCOP_01400 [Maricaulaceae bacterium MS644]
MVRMISGICALGLVVGTYFVCPQALQERINAAISPSPDTIAQVRAGLDSITGQLSGPGELNPDTRL